jgi:hypothetical protein
MNLRPILIVNCYKQSGKWAYGNNGVELKKEHYPILLDYVGDEIDAMITSISELVQLQKKAAYELGELIRNNDGSVKYLSPELFGFDREYIYTIELQIHDEQFGFCQFLMNKCKGE